MESKPWIWSQNNVAQLESTDFNWMKALRCSRFAWLARLSWSPWKWSFWWSQGFAAAVLCLVALSCPTLCDPMDCSPPDSSVHGDSPGKNNGVGYHALFQRIFPIQGWDPNLLHWRWILDTVWGTREAQAYPFSRDLPDPGIELGSPALQADSLAAELPRMTYFWLT